MSGQYLFTHTTSPEWAQWGRILTGIGAAPAFISAVKIASDSFPDKSCGIFIGLTCVLGTIFTILGNSLLEYVCQQNNDWQLSASYLNVLGVILFVITPLFFSILVAFTNYSRGHVPPTELFTWIGLENFASLFHPEANSQFAVLPSAMAKTVGWTITWTFFATFSNYFLGIILALMINKKGIKLKKMWRTILMSISIVMSLIMERA